VVTGAGLAGSVDRVAGVHLINDVGMTLCHPARTAPSIRICGWLITPSVGRSGDRRVSGAWR
jgi:hypothetical protein